MQARTLYGTFRVRRVNLDKDHGAGVNIQFNNGDVAGITSARNDFTLQGVWLELASTFVMSQNAGLYLAVAHLFPVQSNALESYGKQAGLQNGSGIPIFNGGN